MIIFNDRAGEQKKKRCTLMSSNKELMITVEGAYKAGKHTQVTHIMKYLKSMGYDAETLDFPRYGSPSAKKIEDYLNGKMGNIKDLDPREVMKLYAQDRMAHQDILRGWLKSGKVVVLDRYSYSNAFGIAKMPKEKWESELKWLEEMEFNKYGLIKPTYNFYLYIKPEVSFAMKNQGMKQYQNGKPDLHESNFELLYNVSKVYKFIANNDPTHWAIIDEMKPQSEMKNADDIRYNPDDVFYKLYPVLNSLLIKHR